jgi:drug/metabolite transporter (DMT)-like permease
MLGASFAFACMAASVHWLGDSLHWSVVTFCRMFFSVFLLMLLASARRIPIIFSGPPALWVRAGAGSLGMIGNFYAMTALPISDALAIFYTIPIWVAVFRRIVFREALSLLQWGCVFGAVAGVFVSQQFTGASAWDGVAMALGGAMFAAVAFIAMSFLGGIRPESVTIHFSMFASVVAAGAILISLPTGGTFLPSTPWMGLALVIPAALGSIAQVQMTSAMGRGHNVTVSLVGLSQVVFAGLFDVFLWNRSFTLVKLAGLALIAACVALMSLRRAESD